MTSSTPVRPLFPFIDANPPPRKRQKKGEGKNEEELSADDWPEDYSPTGGSGAEEVDEMDPKLEGFLEIEPEAKDSEKPEDDQCACLPCDAMPGFGIGLPCAGHRIPKTLNSPIKPSAEAVE